MRRRIPIAIRNNVLRKGRREQNKRPNAMNCEPNSATVSSNVLRNIRLWVIETVMRGQRHHCGALPLEPGTLRYPRDLRLAPLMRRNKPRLMNDLTFEPAKVVFCSGTLV